MDFFMIWKTILGRFSISCLLLCWVILHHSKAAPVGCPTKGTAVKVLETIRDNYIIVDKANPTPLRSDDDQSSPDVCENNTECPCFVRRTKINTHQIPSSLVTAECKRDIYGQCIGNCIPLKYDIEILEKESIRNEEVEQAIWKRKLVSVTMGYKKVKSID